MSMVGLILISCDDELSYLEKGVFNQSNFEKSFTQLINSPFLQTDYKVEHQFDVHGVLLKSKVVKYYSDKFHRAIYEYTHVYNENGIITSSENASSSNLGYSEEYLKQLLRLNYEFDQEGRISKLTYPDKEEKNETKYGYSREGNLVSIISDDEYLKLVYNNDNRIKSIYRDNRLTVEYEYSGALLKKVIAHPLDFFTGEALDTQVDFYEYDSKDRIIRHIKERNGSVQSKKELEYAENLILSNYWGVNSRLDDEIIYNDDLEVLKEYHYLYRNNEYLGGLTEIKNLNELEGVFFTGSRTSPSVLGSYESKKIEKRDYVINIFSENETELYEVHLKENEYGNLIKKWYNGGVLLEDKDIDETWIVRFINHDRFERLFGF
ncbi:hypothetical protein SAMN04488029_0582 [Reichenbachiella faecimaris]|uniref:Uncharacterized protein n=2 Tax=Reichenbachiella faecimaris TaxID=692418 RepID=A0A1W2G6D0_REIFA|nr:hypothetical protein SAMN04488029_0582 [Reichenbachiella faecimaris]